MRRRTARSAIGPSLLIEIRFRILPARIHGEWRSHSPGESGERFKPPLDLRESRRPGGDFAAEADGIVAALAIMRTSDALLIVLTEVKAVSCFVRFGISNVFTHSETIPLKYRSTETYSSTVLNAAAHGFPGGNTVNAASGLTKILTFVFWCSSR